MSNSNSKIKTLKELSALAKKLKSEGKKIILSHGVYDLLHSGHIHHLEEGKKLGDVLVTSITPDRFINKGKNRPHFKEAERLKFLSALECVDFACVNNSPTAADVIKALRPDVYLKGRDVEEKAKNPQENLHKEIQLVRSCKGKVCFIDSLSIHSTDLINKLKIKSLKELSSLIKKLKAEGQKIVLAHGVFDLIHHAHFNYLMESKKMGDILVVSVVADKFVRKGLEKPIFDENVRTGTLAHLEYVDYVVLCNDFGPWKIIKNTKPDIYTKGEDAASQLKNPSSGLNRDLKIIQGVGGELRFTKSIPVQTSDIFGRYSNPLPEDVRFFLERLKKKYNLADTILNIEQLKKMKVLVIGESIIDEYRMMSPLGKPTKAHIVAAHYLKKEEFAGGAVALANHTANICDNVTLLTYLGKNKPREGFIKKSLNSNVRPVFSYCLNQPTIVKRRFVDSSNYSKLFEEYEFSREFLSSEEEKTVQDYLKKNLKNFDLVIVIDYGHGFLSSKLINTIVSCSKFLAVNTQTNSGNAGFNYITKYPSANYVCVDELEAKLASQDDISDTKTILKSLYKKLGSEKMVVTLGRYGSLAYERGVGFVSTPAMPSNVLDPIGAGDAFLAISAPCAAAGLPLDLVTFIGSVASSVAVGILGNKTSVKREDLFRIMGSLF